MQKVPATQTAAEWLRGGAEVCLEELLFLHSARDKETLLGIVIREVRMYIQDLSAGKGKPTVSFRSCLHGQ